jgi:HNH endonuclease
MKQIRLTRDRVTQVDDQDFERVSQFAWYASAGRRGKFYVTGRPAGKLVFLHRWLLGVESSKIEVDHRDGNSLNNQRGNLRVATRSQNNQNRRGNKTGSSRFKGVSWHRPRQRWQSYIKRDGKTRCLGYFTNEEDAARAYDLAATRCFGEFAALNFQ